MENNIYIKLIKYMFYRNCPNCGNELVYKSKYSRDRQSRGGKLCKSCTVKKEYVKNPLKNSGVNNGRFGKKLKDLMGDIEYSKWLENKNKFGHGVDNPQYGVSPFKNSGMSYKGWYNGLFFRSSFELMFLYEYGRKYEIVSAENSNFRVMCGNSYYYPDFYIEKSNTVFEIKSKQWVQTEKNKLKIDVATEYFFNKGINYLVLTEDDLVIYSLYNNDWQKIIFEFMFEMLLCDDISLTELSMDKFLKRLIKTNRITKLNKLLMKNT